MPDTTPTCSGYLTVAVLAALVREHRRTGRVPEDLGRALLSIAGGVWDRYRFTADRQEFAAECALHLLGRPLAKCDPSRHVFNYLTTCTIRFGQKLRDKGHAERRRFETYARSLADAGVPIPDRDGR